MTKHEFKVFMNAQAEEIKKNVDDLYNACCIEWVNKFAKKFRADYYKMMGWRK